MYEHQIRSSFYPDQICRYLRQHARNFPVGTLVTYADVRPEQYFIVRPQRFRCYWDLWSSSGVPLNFHITMRHVFTGTSPNLYARSKAELMCRGKHPMFTLVDEWYPWRRYGLGKNCRPLIYLPLPLGTVDRMAEFVWEKLPFHSSYSRQHAFSLIMTALEGRLMLEKIVEQTRSGMIPKKWVPFTFRLQTAELATDRLVSRDALLVPSPRAKSRFDPSDNIRFCVPILSKFCGTFVNVDEYPAQIIEDLPAYFVSQKSASWRLLYSDTRMFEAQVIARGRGDAEKQQEKILDTVKQHLVSSLLNETEGTNFLMELVHRHFFKITLLPLSASDSVKCYEDMLARYLRQLQKVFDRPEKFMDKEGDEVKTELEFKVYEIMREAFEVFFPTPDKSLQSN